MRLVLVGLGLWYWHEPQHAPQHLKADMAHEAVKNIFQPHSSDLNITSRDAILGVLSVY